MNPQMTKKIKTLEKETTQWRGKWESNNQALLQMAEEVTRIIHTINKNWLSAFCLKGNLHHLRCVTFEVRRQNFIWLDVKLMKLKRIADAVNGDWTKQQFENVKLSRYFALFFFFF